MTGTRPDNDVDEALDRALSQVLRPPGLPPRFEQRLHASWVRCAADDLAQQRSRLEAEHARQLQALKQGHVRLRRDTLALVLAAAFTAGVAAAWAVPWLREAHGLDLSRLLPLLAVTIGLSSGAGVWVNRFGLPWRR
ncbi:MAG: hypothetical protein AB1430_24180 [Pseudomonadota bacterium]